MDDVTYRSGDRHCAGTAGGAAQTRFFLIFLKAIFLGGLFVLAMLATAFVASEIVLPLVFAIVLKLLLEPACAYWNDCTYRDCWRRCC